MRARAAQDYRRREDNEPQTWSVKLYAQSEIVVAVLQERGIECKRIRFAADDPFVVVRFTATRPQYKAMQFEWLQRMIAAGKQTSKKTNLDIDLFV